MRSDYHFDMEPLFIIGYVLSVITVLVLIYGNKYWREIRSAVMDAVDGLGPWWHQWWGAFILCIVCWAVIWTPIVYSWVRTRRD